MFINIDVIVNATKAKIAFKEIDKVIDGLDKKIKNNMRSLQQGMLGFGLSILFTGMAIKRLADSALRAVMTTMQLATDQTSEFNVLTNTLKANWEFLKFSIMDALMQSGLFQMFIGWIINLISWFTSLPEGVRKWVGVMIIAGVIIGAVMMVIGQTVLAFIGVLALMGITAGVAWGAIAFFAGVVLALIVTLIAIWSSGMDKTAKIMWTVVAVLAAIAIAVFGVSLPLLLIIGIIVALVWFFLFMRDKWDNVWTNMKLVALSVIYIIANAFEEMINFVISGLNFLISQLNKIPGIDIGRINDVDFTSGLHLKMVDIARKQEARDAGVVQNNEITINQKEGEDAAALSQRVVDELMARMTRNAGSTQLG